MEIATNILIAYARVGTSCPHPYGWPRALRSICIFEPFFLFQPAILAVRMDCASVAPEGVINMYFFCLFPVARPLF